MTHIDLQVVRATAVGVAVFGATSCLPGALLLLSPHILTRGQFAWNLICALAFGFLRGLLFGLILGLFFGLIVQVVELGFTVDPPVEAAAFMIWGTLGMALGLINGAATTIWWTVRQRRPPVPTLSWNRPVGGFVAGCLIGLANRAPTTVSERAESALMVGIVTSMIAFLPAVDWWTEELLNPSSSGV